MLLSFGQCCRFIKLRNYDPSAKEKYISFYYVFKDEQKNSLTYPVINAF